MDEIEQQHNVKQTEQASYEIRITTHGKIRAWVDFALDYFEKNEDRPLTFHTLPSTPQQGVRPTSIPENTTRNASESQKVPPSMALIPRLVSVVEVVKREYIKKLDPIQAEKGYLSGLHQYNELGNLEDLMTPKSPSKDPENERREALVQALQGKNYLKQKKTAYMKVTLSRKEILHLHDSNITYQKAALRRLSKSARARAKKRTKQEHSASTAE